MILNNTSHLTGYVIMALVYITTLHGLSINDVRNELAREVKRSIDIDEYQNFRKRELGNGFENPFDILSHGVPKEFECPYLSPPPNSEIRCGGRLCLVKCFHGYISHKESAFVYRCIPEKKEWITLPKGLPVYPLPGCVKVSDYNPMGY